MTATQVIAEIESLPPHERELVFLRVHEIEKATLPESFLQGMKEAMRGDLLVLTDPQFKDSAGVKAYRCFCTWQFQSSYARLTESQQASTLRAYRIFKENPTASLSARIGRTIHSIWINADLRAVFYLDGSDCISVDIGTHSIYRC